MLNWLRVLDVFRGLVFGVLLCLVFLKLFGADTGILEVRYAGY